ncbi:MAG: UPF0149 family protein [Alphaproteobacteria bacterium]
MNPARLRAPLETDGLPPENALRLNQQQAETLLPMVVETMDSMAAGVFLLPRQEHLLFHGLHALAAARCQGLYRPLIRWLRSPDTDVHRALGYGYSGEILPGIALAVFDGDAAPLIEAIEDRTVDGCLRWSLFDVFARLVFDGAISRETALALIDRFDQERLADDGDAAWEGWQDVIQLLGMEERADRVRASWKDARNPQRDVDRQDWEAELRRALAEPADPTRFVEQNIEPLADAVAVLKAVYDRSEPDEESSRIEGKRLPKDPAAKIALGDDEIDWLDGFLRSAQAPDTVMELEALDGFFTALIVGPDLIPPSLYLPVMWGGDGAGPDFDSLEQAEHVMGLLMRHWNTIARRLRRGYPCMPLLAHGAAWPKGRRWAEGFSRGIGLDFEAWEPLIDHEEHAQLLAPIIMLERDDPELVERPPGSEDRNKMLGAALLAAHGIDLFWRDHASADTSAARKIGRNEPCPCGSGKKYKRCCGNAVATTLH